MSDRTTKVSLIANVNGYVSGMEQARRSTEKMSSEAKAKLEAQGQALEKLGKQSLLLGTAAAAGVAVVVKKYADFDKAMSEVQASTHESARNMGLLRDAAIDAGAKTVFSATESANAIEEMAKAGTKTKDILGGGLAGALSLAAAGSLDVGEAAGIAATALTQFNLKGSDIPHVADLLAAGAGKAMGSVQDLSQALNQGGLVASQTGLTIEETTGTLSAFASAGLLGSDAGTSFKSMLQRLTPQSAEAAAKMDELGISAYDAQGNFIGMSEFAGNLKESLSGLTTEQRNSALATIFGSDAVRAASVLYSEGAEGISEWEKKVNDSGYAAETARIKLDNLSGDVEKLGGALDSALIKSGSGANDMLRGLTQGATGLVDSIGNLPTPVLATGVGFTALVAATGLTGGAMLILIPKIAATKAAMAELNLTGKSLAKGFGKGGGVMLAVTALTSAFVGLGSTSELSADNLAKVDDVMGNLSKKKLNELFKDAGTQLVDGTAKADKFEESLNNIASGNFWENSAAPTKFIDGLTFGLTHLSDVYKDNEARLREMGRSLAETSKTDFPAAIEGFHKIAEAAGGGKEQYRQLLVTMPEYKAALIEAASAAGEATDDQSILNLAMGKGSLAADLATRSTVDNSAALEDLSGKAQDASVDIDALAKTIEGFASANLDSRSATRQFESAVDAATDAVKKNGSTLDIGTQKGRDNQAALDDIASSALNMSSKILTATGSQEKASGAISRGRTELIKALGQFGITGKAAKDYADKLGLIPGNVSTAVELNTDPATRALNDWLAANANHTIHVATTGAGGITKATGGYIAGPGTGTSDSIPAMLSNGEYVIKASSTQKNRRALDYINNGGVIQGFASGGLVDARYDFRMDYVWGGKRPADNSGALISQLVAMSRDADTWSVAARKSFRDSAASTQSALSRLQRQADGAARAVDAASSRLDGLRSSSAQMASSVSGSIANTADLSRNGDTSASGIRSFYHSKAASVSSFAGQLKRLTGKGVNGALLAEIAGMGVGQGSEVASALLSASAGDIKAINSDYKSVQRSADAAGKTVADANFKQLISTAERQLANADRNADRITAAMKTQSDKIARMIARALGIKGFASGGFVRGPGSGTSDSIPAMLSNGEFISTAESTRRNRAALEFMNRGGTVRGYARGGYVQYVPHVAQSVAFAQQGVGGAGGGVVNNWTVTSPSPDPVAVAQEVSRRQGMLAV